MPTYSTVHTYREKPIMLSVELLGVSSDEPSCGHTPTLPKSLIHEVKPTNLVRCCEMYPFQLFFLQAQLS
jgi:hypothetical protein